LSLQNYRKKGKPQNNNTYYCNFQNLLFRRLKLIVLQPKTISFTAQNLLFRNGVVNELATNELRHGGDNGESHNVKNILRCAFLCVTLLLKSEIGCGSA